MERTFRFAEELDTPVILNFIKRTVVNRHITRRNDKIEITLADQKEIWQRTINYYARRGYVGDVRRLKQTGTDDPELEHGSFVLARRKALAATFRRMAEQEINITDYIKFE